MYLVVFYVGEYVWVCVGVGGWPALRYSTLLYATLRYSTLLYATLR
jgi:hypothetical protein